MAKKAKSPHVAMTELMVRRQLAGLLHLHTMTCIPYCTFGLLGLSPLPQYRGGVMRSGYDMTLEELRRIPSGNHF